MKRREQTVITFETGHDNFLVDAVDTYDTTAQGQEHVYEAWIYRENMGVKMVMFGVLAEQSGSFEGFCAGIKNLDEFYDIYDKEFGKEDLNYDNDDDAGGDERRT